MPQKLVSVISPCYNVAPYIGRFLDSLIAQTYKKLEVILVNDGSSDNTGDIIKSYIPRLESEGYKVLYIVQENCGQSSAVNNALKHVTGKFLTWPDPDDWLTPDSIEKRVKFLENHPDIGMVRCNAEMIDEESNKSIGLFDTMNNSIYEMKNFFLDLAFTRTWFGSMCCMIRTDYFDEVVAEREIYVEKRAGQNWQMLLPIAYKYPCWQLPDVLAYYLVRKSSHSHGEKTIQEKIEIEYMCERTLTQTLQMMKVSKSLMAEIHADFAKKRYFHTLNSKSTLFKVRYALDAIIALSSIADKARIIKSLLWH